jgi:hypothetical protein
MSWYCKAWPPGVRSCEATATRSRAVRSRPPTVSPLRPSPSPSGGRSFLLSPMLKSRYEGKDARVRDRCTAALFLASPVGDRGEARSGAARSCARATRARGGACRERGERRTRGYRARSGRRNVLQEETREPRTQPPLRRAPPAHLRRIDNPLAVPATERPCPKCGAERKCIGHDVTEVIELIPAEVVVRRDSREKLACSNCDGELPAGASGGCARVARSARALTSVKAWSRC